MRGSFKDLPVVLDSPEGKMSQVEWGVMTAVRGTIHKTLDVTPLLRGLPNDRCQAEHWGYIIKGSVRCKFADHEEVFQTGDLYYMAPGHTAILEAGLEFVEFSPTKELQQTTAAIERNMAKFAAG